MKLIHTADWHLSSPMACRLSKEKADLRRGELLSRFADMVTWAKENAVDAVLLCGDLSDSGVLPLAEQEYILSCIADAAPIRFFLIAGNHDRISDRTVGGCFTRGVAVLPENLIVFGEEWASYPLTGQVTVYGRSLPSHAVEAVLPALDGDKYNIVMLHGQISESSGMLGGADECIPLISLKGRSIDYLALGHEHAFRHKRLDARGTWCYPGCPEGRGFDECGSHGFVVLTIDGTHCTGASFVPFAKRTLHDLTLDVTDISDGLYAVEQALGSLVRDIGRDDLVRVTLIGDDHGTLDLRYLSSRLAERFFYAELRDDRTPVCGNDWDGDLSLRGAFVRAVAASDMTEEEKAAVLRCGLAALEGKEDETFPREESLQ